MREAIEAARKAAEILAEAVGKEVAAEEPSDLEDLLGAQRSIERIRADLKDAVDKLSGHAATLMPARKMFVNGIGEIERVGGWNRSGWDHDKLFAIALARGIDDPNRYDVGTAEVLYSEGEAVLREIRAMAGTPSYWKVGELRKRGLDPSDYCSEEEATPRVKLPKDRTDR